MAHPRNTLLPALLIALTLPVCSADQSPGNAKIPLAAGDRDAFGPLPAEVAGYKVSRGAAPGYVSDLSCKECHEELYQRYQTVGMARSFYRLTAATAVEAFGKPFFQAATGYYYEMVERGGKYYQRRYCMDELGSKFAEHEVEVAWVIGSGNHARTYVSHTAHGELFQMPLSWYAGKGWGMAPGFESKGHDRFERPITRGCMFCHNAYPEVPVGADLPGMAELFPHDLPEGIGCQRCHGPGARHVEAAADPDGTDEEVRARILDLAGFTPRQSEELCMTCHMQPDVSSGGNSTSRAFDKPEYGHRPDQSIHDYITYFDFGPAADREAKIEVNHHGHRMRQSRCYTASDGNLTCLSCHDPHHKAPAPERVAFYRQKCLQCHQLSDCQMEEMGTSRDPAEADCVSCHMLEARPRDVIQVTITDHLIRRRAPKRDLTGKQPDPAAPTGRLETVPVFPERGPHGALLELHTGLAKSLRLQRDEVPAMLAALRALPHKHRAAFLRCGMAISDCGDQPRAIEVLRQGVRQFPGDSELLWNLGMALHKDGQHAAALPHVDASLTIRRSPRALELRGSLLTALNQLEPARAALDESLRLRPVFADTWRRFGGVQASLGQTDAAIAAFRAALARNPDVADTYRRLFELLLAQGKPQAALQILRQGASRLFETRLSLVVQRAAGDARVRDAAIAVRQAEAALRSRPASGRAQLHLAFALTLAGRTSAVESTIARARTQGADPASCTGLLALYRLFRGGSAGVKELCARFEQEKQLPGTEPLRATIDLVLQANLKRRR